MGQPHVQLPLQRVSAALPAESISCGNLVEVNAITLPTKLARGEQLMSRAAGRILFGVLLLCLLSASVFAQGRGRGLGLGRKSDVFVNSHDARNARWDGRGPNQNWKCSVFVNCHDARNGRWDGRGRRVSVYRNSIFSPRSSRVRYGLNRGPRQSRLDRLEMMRQERIAERRYFSNRGSRRP